MKKNEYRVLNTSNIKWLINENSPQYYKFKSFNNLSFVNPLYYQSNTMELNISQTLGYSKIDSKYYQTTDGLIFKKHSETIDEKKFTSFLDSFIKHIRTISKQATLNYNNYLYSWADFSIDDLTRFSDSKKTENMFIPTHIYSTLITWDMVVEADKRAKNNYQTPIYIEILIDALSGLINHDYRKVILYSSIAMESMLGIELDKRYEEIIRKNKGSAKYRVSKFSTPNGLVYKDPVYQKLREETKFSYFLHERPLYILNKSILIDNEKLYKDAIKLYLTRNKIVHLGEPFNNTNTYLTINHAGAKEAFLIAREVFGWIGIKEFDSVRLDKFTEL